jgi:hypothetical protein
MVMHGGHLGYLPRANIQHYQQIQAAMVSLIALN